MLAFETRLASKLQVASIQYPQKSHSLMFSHSGTEYITMSSSQLLLEKMFWTIVSIELFFSENVYNSNEIL